MKHDAFDMWYENAFNIDLLHCTPDEYAKYWEMKEVNEPDNDIPF